MSNTTDGRPIPDAGTSAAERRQANRELPMRVAVATFVTPSDERLRFIRQLGVEDIILWGTTFRNPRQHGGGDVPYKELVSLRNRVENHGLRLFAVETLPAQMYDKLIFGKEGREQQLEHFISTIRHVGRAGIAVLGYNWMPQGVWRTSLNTPLRGGATSTGFALAEASDAPLIRGRRFSEEEFWGYYTWFIERVLPVAEEEGVTLALHPNDPPVPEVGGAPCLFRSRAAFDRAMEIRPSSSHGLCFCLGNWTEMGEDIYDAIKHYGSREELVYVHFQAVRGRVPNFHETFIDEADYDAWKLVKAFDAAKFRGVMIPGHVPEMEGDEPWRTQESLNSTPYYHPMGGYRGRAYTVGYLKGLLHALRDKPGVVE
ncbi:mannonate dehydratase [Aeoliella sp.]|uniref:mannonate dehydratase n=1 Tax=Aeoliella sp. TaxID=2795800 RepID=UPI003CCBA7C9